LSGTSQIVGEKSIVGKRKREADTDETNQAEVARGVRIDRK